MLCACDIYRPAAIDQLEVVAAGADVPVYVDRNNPKAEEIAVAARKEAERKGRDVLIVDTAGRLQIDEELMEELARVKKAVKPHEILLVVDAPHRTGRGERRRGLQRKAGHRRNHNDQDGRRFQRRSSPFSQESDGEACQIRRYGRKSWMLWSLSTPTGWPAEYLAWATCFPS